MPSIDPLDLHTDFASENKRASSQKLDADHAALENWANQKLLPALGKVIRDDDTLANGIVRTRNLHAEVLARIDRGGESSNASGYSVTMSVDSPYPITNGEKRGSVSAIYPGVITGWKITADKPASTTVQIWKRNAARPTAADLIGEASVSGGTMAHSSSMDTWDTEIEENDVFVMSVTSNDNAQNISVIISVAHVA